MTTLISRVGQNGEVLYRLTVQKTLIYAVVAVGTLCDYIIMFPAIRFERWMGAIMITALLQSIGERFLTKERELAVRRTEAYELPLAVENPWARAGGSFIRFLFPYFSLCGVSFLLERGEMSRLPSHIFRHYIIEIFRYAFFGGTISCVLHFFFPFRMKIDASSLGTVRRTFAQESWWSNNGALRRLSNFTMRSISRCINWPAEMTGIKDLSEGEDSDSASDQSSSRESDHPDRQDEGFGRESLHVHAFDRCAGIDIPDDEPGTGRQGGDLKEGDNEGLLQRQNCRNMDENASDSSEESDIVG